MYVHGDSDAPGSHQKTHATYRYDRTGTLVEEQQQSSGWASWEKTIRYRYMPTGDTIRQTIPDDTNYGIAANVDRWERNGQRQLVRHYRLYVLRSGPKGAPDTVWHSSQRYAYAPNGQQTLAWYDYIYLGRFYLVTDPDTVHYQYNAQGKLIGETHRYTTSMRNKQEMDATKIDPKERNDLMSSRKYYLEGYDESGSQYNRTDQIRYQYEPFDPKRHQRLAIPIR